jgi:hypothetical protein
VKVDIARKRLSALVVEIVSPAGLCGVAKAGLTVTFRPNLKVLASHPAAQVASIQ